MTIEYLEVRNFNRVMIGIIDTAKSTIWHSSYFGVGDFEVYALATSEHLSLLKQGRYITRPDDIEIGIIERVEITQNAQDGLMIIASGRFAKSFLDRRLIYQLSGKTNKATILRGNVESAARALVANNAISCSWNVARNVPFLELGEHSGSTAVIRDESGRATQKQVSYQNLLEYTDSLLEEYGMGATVLLDDETKKLRYTVYSGVDRSTDNEAGNEPIIFSREFDNLVESTYEADDTEEKNVALIGGEGEGIQRFYSILEGSEVGLARREVFVEGSEISKKYQTESQEEAEYTDAEYKEMLDSLGKQKLAQMIAIERFAGTLDITHGNWILNKDFALGDIVTVQDNQIGKYASVRITEVTEVQDENGYTVEVTYR